MHDLRRGCGVCLLVGATLILPSATKAANLSPAAGIFDEVHGVRSAGMGGAHRGVGSSNDTLFLNPAGMAIGRRYSVELNFRYSPFDDLAHFNISAVDSKSGPVAGGLAYTHTRGDNDGVKANLHRIFVGAAYAISDAIALGATFRHIRGDFRENGKTRDLALSNGDAGIMIRLAENIGIGLTANNMFTEQLNRMMPRTFGVGVSYGGGPLTLAADFDINVRKTENTLESYHLGGEYFVDNAFPLRIGFFHTPYFKKGKEQAENILSLGAGWVSETGAVGIAFDRSFERPKNWTFFASLQFYL